MATEAPLLRHTQCVAAANYSITAGLDGPNGAGQFLFVNISAARTVAVVATSATVIHGVLQNDPTLGQAADVGFMGVTKVVAGAAISAGAGLMSDTAGRAITATTAGTNPVAGWAIEAATAANQVITMMLVPQAIG